MVWYKSLCVTVLKLFGKDNVMTIISGDCDNNDVGIDDDDDDDGSSHNGDSGDDDDDEEDGNNDVW